MNPLTLRWIDYCHLQVRSLAGLAASQLERGSPANIWLAQSWADKHAVWVWRYQALLFAPEHETINVQEKDWARSRLELTVDMSDDERVVLRPDSEVAS